MEVTPHINSEFFCKEPINIFDEIENLLSTNEVIQSNQWDAEILKGKNGELFNADNLIQTVNNIEANGSFYSNLPPPLVPIASTKPKPSSRLFVVANGELQPIRSPLKSSGIFKKTDTMSNGCDIKHHRVANVINTGAEPNGRVLSKKDFLKLYVTTPEEPEDKIEIFAKSNSQIIKNTDGRSTNSTLCSNGENGQLDNTWDPLSKLAYNMFQLSNHDHIVIDRKRNEIIRTESGTNQKIIYRFLSPQSVQMDVKTNGETSPKRATLSAKRKLKVGRPRKNRENLEQKRTKSGSESDTNFTTKSSLIEENFTLKETRTRSGRIAKVIQPNCSSASGELDKADTLESPVQYFRSVSDDFKDSDYDGKKSTQPKPTEESEIPKQKQEKETQCKFSTRISTKNPNTKRRIPPNSICPTCHKIFLGRRLQRHFIKYPDHMKTVPNDNTNDPTKLQQQSTNSSDPAFENMSLFSFLISKLQKSNLNEDQKADLFLNEINDFVEQLQVRSSRLIRNTSGLHFVTTRSARVLGIPEGQYALDMTAIEAARPDPEPETTGMNNFENVSTMPVPSIHSRSLDYTAISMDDTLTDEAIQKLNLSAGGKLLPPSEETLLRVVDDLVQGNIANLDAPNLLIQPENNTPATNVETLAPNYEHANDNAVEAVSMKVTPTHVTQQTTPLLDLSVDFFQFKKN